MPTEPFDEHCHARGMTEVCRDSDDDWVRIKYTYYIASQPYEYLGYTCIVAYCCISIAKGKISSVITKN